MTSVICIAGKNDIAVNVMQYCLEHYSLQNEIIASLTKNDDGKNGWQRSYRFFCEQNNIRVVQLSDLYEVENLLFVSAEFDQIINPLNFKTEKLINIHFSLLPQYKGMYPSVLPILHNKKESGVTLHMIRKGIDTGEIIDQIAYKIHEDDTAYDVYLKNVQYGTELILKNLDSLLSGEFTYVKQSFEESSYYSKDSIDYRRVELNCNATACQIRNSVRAFSFRPYQLIKYCGIDIIECEITDEVSDQKPGSLLEENDIYCRVSTIDYNVRLYKDVLDDLIENIQEMNNDKAKYLCASNRIINEKNTKGWSPLMVSTFCGNEEMFFYLIRRGASIFDVNYNGTNMLMYAKEAYKSTKRTVLFNYIRDKGISELQKDYYGKNLLFYIAKEGISFEELIKREKQNAGN